MADEQPRLGRRIAVIGTSGCGKTFVAETLAAKLGLTYISNDSIIWRPDWQETPHEERAAQIDAATQAETWTFDGNLSDRNVDKQIVRERCDTFVWLDLPRWQVWSQVVLRTIARVLTRRELWHGNRESLRMMLSRDSVIVWSVTSFSRRRHAYEAMFADPAYEDRIRIRLSSRGQVDRWLASVTSVAV